MKKREYFYKSVELAKKIDVYKSTISRAIQTKRLLIGKDGFLNMHREKNIQFLLQHFHRERDSRKKKLTRDFLKELGIENPEILELDMDIDIVDNEIKRYSLKAIKPGKAWDIYCGNLFLFEIFRNDEGLLSFNFSVSSSNKICTIETQIKDNIDIFLDDYKIIDKLSMVKIN